MLITETATIALILISSASQSHTYISENPIQASNQVCIQSEKKLSYIENISEKDRVFNRVEAKLTSYFDLESDWDGYSAIPPAKEVIKSSLLFLSIVKSQNFLLPTPMLSGKGEVGLYWENEESYLEIGFDTPKLLSYLIDSPANLAGEDDLLFNKNLIPTPVLRELTKFSTPKA